MSSAFAEVSGEKLVNRGEAFRFIGEYLLTDMPKSYQYIELKFTDVKKNTKLYDSLQKLVYLDVIENKPGKVFAQRNISSLAFYSFLETLTGFDFILDGYEKDLEGKVTTYQDLVHVAKIVQDIQDTAQEVPSSSSSSSSGGGKYSAEEENAMQIYYDVYDTIHSGFYGKNDVKNIDLIYGSIQGLADATGDKYTTFFPPSEAKNFDEWLAWEFEGIGAYVDMVNPGVFQIISPISGFPAEKAGIKWGDIVLEIGTTKVTPELSLQQAVALIKWPAGTFVKLKILRGEQELMFEVKREKIILNDVEYKLENGIFYIQIRMFGDKVNTQFIQALEALKKEPNVKKVVIDLRNNPGGYLDQVTEMLSQFIKKWESVAVIKYLDGDLSYSSKWYEGIDLNKYQVYLLGNSGTASASEIMIGTLKDYFPNIVFVWEKTFWKGSVQTVRNYFDGSTFKYTIAKWYTGKSQTGIDGVGIQPDVEVKLDEEKMKAWVDSQLEWVKNR